MDFRETVSMAQVAALDALISGNNFRGLGPLAQHLIMLVSQPAIENATAHHGRADRFQYDREDHQEMVKLATRRFVLDVTGFNGVGNTSLATAVETLVEYVFREFANWARWSNTKAG